jgi:hypothetical protein
VQIVGLVDALKWPMVALLLAGAALWYLLPQVRALIARITRVKFKDAEASADQAAVSAQAVIEAPRTVAASGPHPFERGDSAYIRQVADQMGADVRSMSFSTADERDKWMFREGARLSIALDFERLYRAIWASQMELIGAANLPDGVTVQLAQQRYQAAALRAPGVYNTYPFEKWMGFLEAYGFVRHEAGKFFATEKANLFVQYLVAMHYDLHGLRHDL